MTIQTTLIQILFKKSRQSRQKSRFFHNIVVLSEIVENNVSRIVQLFYYYVYEFVVFSRLQNVITSEMFF